MHVHVYSHFAFGRADARGKPPLLASWRSAPADWSAERIRSGEKEVHLTAWCSRRWDRRSLLGSKVSYAEDRRERRVELRSSHKLGTEREAVGRASRARPARNLGAAEPLRPIDPVTEAMADARDIDSCRDVPLTQTFAVCAQCVVTQRGLGAG